MFFSLSSWELIAIILAVVGGMTAGGMLLGRYLRKHSETLREPFGVLQGALLGLEPVRSRSLARLREYTDLAIRISHEIPNSPAMRRTIAQQDVIQRQLWRLGGEAIDAAPIASAPRLYVDSLNSTIDEQTVRVSALNNRVPGAVLAIEVIGASVALGLLALYLSVLGRGLWPMLLASALVSTLLLVTFDLDRPTRGLITVPSTPFDALRVSMALPPAAHP